MRRRTVRLRAVRGEVAARARARIECANRVREYDADYRYDLIKIRYCFTKSLKIRKHAAY